MSLTKAERETIVRWSDDPDEPMTVYTHRENMAQKLLRAGATLKREGKEAGRTISWTLEAPREWFRWPRKRPKATPEQAEKRRLSGIRMAQAQRSAKPTDGDGGPGAGKGIL